MTIDIIAILNIVAAMSYANNNSFLCVVYIIVSIVWFIAAIVKERYILNRIKKLEEEFDILKRR